MNVDARLERALAVPLAIDATIAGSHADDPAVLEQRLGSGEAGEHIDALRFDERRHPLAKAAHRNDGVAMVPKRRRRERDGELPAGVEQVDAVLVDIGVERRPGGAKVGNELRERPRIEHGARQQVGTRLPCLLDHRDRQRGTRRRLLQLGETQRRRHPCRSATDDENVDLEGLAFAHFFSSAVSAGRNSNRSPTKP